MAFFSFAKPAKTAMYRCKQGADSRIRLAVSGGTTYYDMGETITEVINAGGSPRYVRLGNERAPGSFSTAPGSLFGEEYVWLRAANTQPNTRVLSTNFGAYAGSASGGTTGWDEFVNGFSYARNAASVKLHSARASEGVFVSNISSDGDYCSLKFPSPLVNPIVANGRSGMIVLSMTLSSFPNITSAGTNYAGIICSSDGVALPYDTTPSSIVAGSSASEYFFGVMTSYGVSGGAPVYAGTTGASSFTTVATGGTVPFTVMLAFVVTSNTYNLLHCYYHNGTAWTYLTSFGSGSIAFPTDMAFVVEKDTAEAGDLSVVFNYMSYSGLQTTTNTWKVGYPGGEEDAVFPLASVCATFEKETVGTVLTPDDGAGSVEIDTWYNVMDDFWTYVTKDDAAVYVSVADSDTESLTPDLGNAILLASDGTGNTTGFRIGNGLGIPFPSLGRGRFRCDIAYAATFDLYETAYEIKLLSQGVVTFHLRLYYSDYSGGEIYAQYKHSSGTWTTIGSEVTSAASGTYLPWEVSWDTAAPGVCFFCAGHSVNGGLTCAVTGSIAEIDAVEVWCGLEKAYVTNVLVGVSTVKTPDAYSYDTDITPSDSSVAVNWAEWYRILANSYAGQTMPVGRYVQARTVLVGR